MARPKSTTEGRTLLAIHPDSIVDNLGDSEIWHERGEVKYYTDAEARRLLAMRYPDGHGRPVFVRVDNDEPDVDEPNSEAES